MHFRRHNLAREPGPPTGEQPFDLVVCRDVLIYFEAAAVRHALATLEAALQPDGILLLGSADRLCVPRARGRRPSGPPVARPQPGRVGSVRGRGAGSRYRRARARGRVPEGQPRGAAGGRIRAYEPGPSQAIAAPRSVDAAVAAANDALTADPLSGEAYFLRATVGLSR